MLPGLLDTLEVILQTAAQFADICLALLFVSLHLRVEGLLSRRDEGVGLLAADPRRILDFLHFRCNRRHLARLQALQKFVVKR